MRTVGCHKGLCHTDSTDTRVRVILDPPGGRSPTRHWAIQGHTVFFRTPHRLLQDVRDRDVKTIADISTPNRSLCVWQRGPFCKFRDLVLVTRKKADHSLLPQTPVPNHLSLFTFSTGPCPSRHQHVARKVAYVRVIFVTPPPTELNVQFSPTQARSM
eukprot:1602665-Prymnesium_polylepis.1